MRADNLTRNETMVTTGQVAASYWSRLRGLSGHEPLAEREALLSAPRHSIHTHFMGFPIDDQHVGKGQQVVAINHDVAPWRFGSIRRGARFVIELPAGTVAATGIQTRDQLEVQGSKTSGIGLGGSG